MFLVRAKLNLFQNQQWTVPILCLYYYNFFFVIPIQIQCPSLYVAQFLFQNISLYFLLFLKWSVRDTCIPSPSICSLRQHPFLLALCRWGRFLRAKRPQRRRARRNGCFRRLTHLHISLFPVICFELSVTRTFPSSGHRESTVLRDRKRGETDGGQRRSRGGSLSPSQ